MKSSPIVAGDAAGLQRAVAALRAGQTVGLPTETVYGLAADASNPSAVASIYAIKGRPTFNPLIAHVADTAMARREGILDARAEALAEAFWPGPLTLVMPVANGGQTCELARAGLDTIAVRVPSQPIAQALLQAIGVPLAAPSANPSGRLSPTRAEEVAAELGDAVRLVLDGGPCRSGVESSIVAVLPDAPPTLLRPGAIPRAELEAIVGPLADRADTSISAPGQLRSHYAPRAQLRLNAQRANPGEVLLGFGPASPADTLCLSRSADLAEAAANLYQYLRRLDASGAAAIAVMPIPDTGLGEAINDRLQRAAAPRG
jgi:L-threonylcarbamoyladenylate synthase